MLTIPHFAAVSFGKNTPVLNHNDANFGVRAVVLRSAIACFLDGQAHIIWFRQALAGKDTGTRMGWEWVAFGPATQAPRRSIQYVSAAV